MPNERLRDKIKQNGLTNKEIAEKLFTFSIREETVFQWVDGRRVPTARVKKAIARLLGCKVSDIF